MILSYLIHFSVLSLVANEAFAQSVSSNSFDQVRKNLAEAAVKANPGLPKGIEKSECLGILKVRTHYTKTPGDAGIPFMLGTTGKTYQTTELPVTVTLLDGHFTHNREDMGKSKVIATSWKSRSGRALFKMECIDAYETNTLRFNISNFPKTITPERDSKTGHVLPENKRVTYEFMYAQVAEPGQRYLQAEDPHRLYNMLKNRSLLGDQIEFGIDSSNLYSSRITDFFPETTEVNMAAGSSLFVVDVVYGLKPQPPKAATATVKYNFPSCRWDFEPKNAESEMAKFNEAMEHNIESGYICDVYVSAGASNTGVNPACLVAMSAKTPHEANKKLANKRAEAVAESIGRTYIPHGNIKAEGVVAGNFIGDANSEAAAAQQYLTIKLDPKDCLRK